MTEDYRDQLERVAYDAYLRSEDYLPDHGGMVDAAEAVAAQVLRDVLALFVPDKTDSVLAHAHKHYADTRVRRFASGRGIEIGGDG